MTAYCNTETEAQPLKIGDKSYVRIRTRSTPMGPFRMTTYILTSPRNRRAIGKAYPMESMARLEAERNGWTILARQLR